MRQEHDVPEDELQIRKREDELFSKLTHQFPTKLEGVSDVLGDDVTDEITEQREKSKKRQAAYQERKSKAKRRIS